EDGETGQRQGAGRTSAEALAGGEQAARDPDGRGQRRRPHVARARDEHEERKEREHGGQDVPVDGVPSESPGVGAREREEERAEHCETFALGAASNHPNSRSTVIECVTSTPAKYPSEFIRNARKFR